MTRPATRLRLTTLESREVPAALAFGDGFANPDLLTLSFAPDGTTIGQLPKSLLGVDSLTVPLFDSLGLAALNAATNPLLFGLGGILAPSDNSNLNAAFNGLGRPAEWQREILRAFQTWVVQTNLNVALTADAGTKFGATGDLQADSRFGDIRIGGKKQSTGSLATAVATGDANGTWSGDVLFNTATPFKTPTRGNASAYDLYTVAVHEAGHVFGLEHSDDPNSVMVEQYNGRKAGLSAGDVATVQSYYGGARKADPFDAAAANDTIATATRLAAGGGVAVTGDLGSLADVDTYSFTVPATWLGFTAKLRTSGISLLTAKLTVLNAAGTAVASDISTDPADGNLEIRVTGATPGGTYFLKVEGASEDVFGIGRYQLSVAPTSATVAAPPKAFAIDGGTNDTAATATVLAGEVLEYHGKVESVADADFYRVQAPAGTAGLWVHLRRLNPNDAAVGVAGFDSASNPVPTEVVSDDGYTVVARVLVPANGTVNLKVAAAGAFTGSGYYHLAVTSTADLSANAAVGSGTLTVGRPSVAYSTELTTSGLVRYTLGATNSNSPTSAVTLDVYDSTGQRVLTLRHDANQDDVTGSAYLAAGRYTLRLTASFPIWASGTASVAFRLMGGLESDPIGPYASNASASPSSGGSTSGGSSSGGTTSGGSSGGSTSTATTSKPYMY